ncbi:hypothetical protein [Luteibaculum oceani]|uniref:Uncharacterized protein n=1 Tax=Luteibaculum oceani TaxID=1294296 RepID=A0A5C6VPY4_9FLAO|nr:hypothetical protein [Luteibaculum oceani]TXC85458.1 hypothetical protein FRX97_02180 [Luteibaculum oceani]
MTRFLLGCFLLIGFIAKAQVDTTSNEEEDFDFSDFELATEPAKAFCNNKVLGQLPTTLVGIQYNFQSGHAFTPGNLVAQPEDEIAEQNDIQATHGFTFTTNLPLISRNNILINANVVYDEQHYSFKNPVGNHPLARSINQNGLRSLNTLFTVFKPLNANRFILGQIGFGLNGNYAFGEFQSLNTLRVPVAALYGWKPSDKLMYAVGLSRTYLGGALNYVPIFYYYRTFDNEKWGLEALLPARALLRYRFNTQSVLSFGFNVVGNTYRLGDFAQLSNQVGNDAARNTLMQANGVELKRSEILLGLRYQKAVSGFFWLTVESGLRINYSYELDEGGDFARPFGNDKPYYIENELGNPLYFQIGISYVSP